MVRLNFYCSSLFDEQLLCYIELVAQLEGKVLREDSGKDVTHRKKVIDEVLNTEKSFARDLNLCLRHFMMQLIEWKVRCLEMMVVMMMMMMMVVVDNHGGDGDAYDASGDDNCDCSAG